MTGANCWATAPLSPPCWIGCCTTDTFSSAAREAGEPKPPLWEKANGRNRRKGKNNPQERKKKKKKKRKKKKKKRNRGGGQRGPGGGAPRDPEASYGGASP